MGVFLALWIAIPAAGERNEIADLKQTTATDTSVTVAFQTTKGAEKYRIYSSLHGKNAFVLRRTVSISKGRAIVRVPVSAKGASRYYDIAVAGCDSTGKELFRTVLEKCPTLPGKVSGIRQKSLYTARKLQLSWKPCQTASGYQIETYNYKTKAKTVYGSRGSYSTIPMEPDTLYKVRIRGYVELKVNGQNKRLYSPYTTVYTAQEPRIVFAGQDRRAVTAMWKEVYGADSYAVFLSKSQKTGYQRIAVTESSETVIDGLTPGIRYYVLVRVNKRVKGILHRSPATYVYPFRIDA